MKKLIALFRACYLEHKCRLADEKEDWEELKKLSEELKKQIDIMEGK